MSYNYKKIKKIVEDKVREACFSEKNQYGSSVWKFHILSVVKFSLILGKKLKADLEILELAALLHDYGAVMDEEFAKEHHIYGARLAGELLSELKYPEEKIKKVQVCIYAHRGSLKIPRKTLEEKIVASADAMAHVTEVVDMMFLTFGLRGEKTVEGAKWLRAKLERSWNKIMPEGKEMVKEDYKIITKLLDDAILK